MLHGGTLQAWGRAGEGSEFVLTLPRVVDPARRSVAPLPVVRRVFA